LNPLSPQALMSPLEPQPGSSRERKTVPVQIAHLCGAGGYDDPSVDKAFGVFMDAIAKHDRRMAHVYFDISGITGIGQWKEKSEMIATRVRQLDLRRVLYGSDGAVREHPARALDPISATAVLSCGIPRNRRECHSLYEVGRASGSALPWVPEA
jgi:hypothetical protein